MTWREPQLLGALPWAADTIVCVASGPSAKDVDLSIAKGRARVIVVNESWRLAPWADLLYGCDPSWWMVQPSATAGRPSEAEFAGLRATQDRGAAGRLGLKLVTLTRGQDKLLVETPGVLGWGGNGGFHALNIAVQALRSSSEGADKAVAQRKIILSSSSEAIGQRKIILVGYDLHDGAGKHWHGDHRAGLNNPSRISLTRWAKILDAQAPLLAALGIDVVNASPTSALTAYPVAPLAAALN